MTRPMWWRPAALLCCAATLALCAPPAHGQAPPRVLLVTAHPDDDAAFAGAVYQVTHKLGGVADLALVTDGGGGFRYATLAEPIYGLRLTDSTVARNHLPAIRKRELMAGGAIVGLRNYFFLDQPDLGYTQDVDSVFRAVWDTALVRRQLAGIMDRGGYDVVVGLVPYPETHAHHKGATLLALAAAQSLPPGRRPVVLAGFPCAFDGRELEFGGLPGHPLSRVSDSGAIARFDRRQKLGHDGRLDFRIIANWVIAEHKSQGTMQLLMNRGDVECYWYFDANGDAGRRRVRDLFAALQTVP